MKLQKILILAKWGFFKKFIARIRPNFARYIFGVFKYPRRFSYPPNIQKSQSKFRFQLVQKVKIRNFHFFSKIHCNDIRTVKCCISGWTRAYNQATQNKPHPDLVGLIFNIPPTARTVNQRMRWWASASDHFFRSSKFLHNTTRHPSASRPTAYRVLDLRFAGRYRRPFALPDSGRG